MKYNSILTSTFSSAFSSARLASVITLLCLLIGHQAVAADSRDASDIKQKRWFEIEVILFKQTAKNSDNTEQFTASDLSYKKRRAFDLLSPYIQPDIGPLKKLLASCAEQQPKFPYDISITPHELWLDNISVEAINVTTANTLAPPVENMSVTVIGDPPSETDNTPAPATDKVMLEPLTEAAYQVQYANKALAVYTQYPTNSDMPLCIIPTETVKQNLTAKQLEDFNIDGFPVEKLATTINGLEQWQDDENGEITWASETPYLISQDSLRLKSIVNRLKRSRNYAPLLHLGWRQVGESRRQAKAIKLFAGENLVLAYQQKIAKQHAEQTTLALQASLAQRQQAEIEQFDTAPLTTDMTAQPYSNNTLDNNVVDNAAGNVGDSIAAVTEISLEEQIRQQAKQQQLNKIFEQFYLLTDFDSAQIESKNLDSHTVEKNSASSENSTAETLYSEAEEEQIKRIIAELSFDISAESLTENVNSAADITATIEKPRQPWLLDGLFKVHLDHYLYINSEFNIIDQSAKKTTEDNVISFKQDRRVITGEIHYFDHPYIGMIVQIRRFDPTKPASEAVSQSKK